MERKRERSDKIQKREGSKQGWPTQGGKRKVLKREEGTSAQRYLELGVVKTGDKIKATREPEGDAGREYRVFH